MIVSKFGAGNVQLVLEGFWGFFCLFVFVFLFFLSYQKAKKLSKTTGATVKGLESQTEDFAHWGNLSINRIVTAMV